MKRILLLIISGVLYTSCQVENINYYTPVVATDEPQNVQTTSATLGGAVIAEGGKDVTEYGIVYAVGGTPSITDNKIPLGERIGESSANYDIFEPGTSYNYSFYATNSQGTSYGDVYSFTTSSPAPCNPVQNNYINTGMFFNGITITDIFLDRVPSIDYNLEFETFSFSSTIRIFLRFKEIDQRFPLTGTYTTVGEFDSQSPYSDGKVEMFLWNFGSEIGGASAAPGLEIYVENNDGAISFIFCDLELNQYYTLNGKYTYYE